MLTADLRRYGAALFGSAGSSGSQFLLTLLLLGRMPAGDFARFTFLVLVAQFAWAIAAALFSAPLSRLAAGAIRGEDSGLRAVVRAQFAFALASGAIALLAALALRGDVGAWSAFAALLTMGGLRSFLRVLAYAEDRQRSVVMSDAAFTAFTLALVGLIWTVDRSMLVTAFAGLALANGAALAVLRPVAILARTRQSPRQTVAAYREVWSRFSLWSLIGVVATEATANAHSYVVTLMAGPAAFSPIAASAVLIRPAAVALNALSEFDRARMARQIADGDAAALARTTRMFRWAALLLWAGTVVLTGAALMLWPGVVFRQGYDMGRIGTCAWLWLLILLLRTSYMAEAVRMQARGAFLALAWPRIWSAPVSVAGAVVMLVLGDPEWSLAAIAVGEGVSAILLLRAARRRPDEREVRQ